MPGRAETVELWCVRHGEATHNVDYERRGAAAYVDPRHVNADLTPRGKAQAARCVLPGRPDVAVSSPLRRALLTAHIALRPYPDTPLVVLDCIREFPNGQHTPNVLFRSQDTWHPTRPETPADLRRRVASFKRWVWDVAHVHGTVAVFGHTSFFRELLQREADLPHAEPVVHVLRRPAA